jgi:ABC-type polysaccharide/polyol phosphate export permease
MFGEMLREQKEYHELLLQMTRRDLVLRYKQAIMGFGWAICMPVLNMVVFSIIFTRVAPVEIGVPYPIYAYTGLLPWNLFANSLKFSAASLTGNTSLVTKVYFPREIFPFSAILVSLVDFAVASSVLIALMVYYHTAVTWAVLFLPIVLLVQIVFTAAVALLVAMGNLFYRDVKYLSELGIVIWMFATSVVYPIDRIGGNLGFVLKLNPMTPLIDAYRSILLGGKLPAAAGFSITAAFSLIFLLAAWAAFHRAEFHFAENI